MMDKKYLTPLELIKIATDHAYCAEHLLQDNAELTIRGHGVADTLAPFISLMYAAFELTLKAYLIHGFKTNNQYKNLVELLELSADLGLSNQDIQLLKKLSRQYAFRKGVDYELWDDRQQLQVFCTEIIDLYERLQQLMPLELHKDYL
ncbi:hypothetical protein BN59_00271 [Legionella massiliensis]|uniref:HEPN domain-containing protein n=2 Tax=Legionella massiliensis TaxID=1034943 RepID=A0A078KST3_9GAMM|nr:hypothetical protein BN59_00271 [Legionella massiliensis]CEE11745.1 hypothetical protein BN1094_00271 [Legionella massiliensis]